MPVSPRLANEMTVAEQQVGLDTLPCFPIDQAQRARSLSERCACANAIASCRSNRGLGAASVAEHGVELIDAVVVKMGLLGAFDAALRRHAEKGARYTTDSRESISSVAPEYNQIDRMCELASSGAYTPSL